jgi:hypothetical protein
MMHLIALTQASQDGHRLRDSRLVNIHLQQRLKQRTADSSQY